MLPLAPVGGAESGDGGVDADESAVAVDQGSAGIARIDRRVGLDRIGDDRRPDGGGGDTVLRRHRPVQRAHDAEGDRVREAQRVAERHHRLTHPHSLGVTELQGGEVNRTVGDLDDRQVRGAVAADQLGAEHASVGKRHPCLSSRDCGRDHMAVGQHVPLSVDDDA